MKVALWFAGILGSLLVVVIFWQNSEKVTTQIDVRDERPIIVGQATVTAPPATPHPAASAPVGKGAEGRDFRHTALNLMRLDARELREVYRRGEQSSFDGDKYLAFLAGDYCVQVLLDIRPQVSQEMSGDQWREHERAARLLKSRCADFYGMPGKDLAAGARGLVASLISTDSDYSPGRYQLGRNDTSKEVVDGVGKRLRAAIERDGAASLIYISEGLASWLELAAVGGRSSTIDPIFRQSPTLLTVSVHLAECRLGYSCDGESMSYLTNCASGVGCHGSFEAYLLDSLSETERATATQQATVITLAIQSKRLKPLGL